MLEASPVATWEKASPLSSYNPASKQRDPKAGAHLSFHKLAALLRGRKKRRLFDKAAVMFANEHGLLGLFYEHCSEYVAPPGKFWVAPNAIIEDGTMRPMEPETEGKERLEAFLHEEHRQYTGTNKKVRLTSRNLALPEQLEFYSTSRIASELPAAEAFGAPPAGVLTWEDVAETYGAVALLDSDAERGVSIVPTKERLSSWRLECRNFPRAPYGHQITRGLNVRISGVWPYAFVSEDGEVGRGWRYRSLLQAMYLMVYLDFTGGKKVQECARPDCRRYYRLGSHESVYCSSTCTSVMTTRHSRES